MVASLLITNEGGLVEVEGSCIASPVGRAILETAKLNKSIAAEEEARGWYIYVCQRGGRATFRYWQRIIYGGELIPVFIEE
jgi:hypothetical protein